MKFRVQLALLILATSTLGLAQGRTSDGQNNSFQEPVTSADHGSSFIENRLQVATLADAEQPHWIAPLFTVTPRLLEQVRFDTTQATKGAYSTTNFGAGKGLELIPTEKTEITVSSLPYVAHTKPGTEDGFGDMSFLFKYRLAAGNEQRGNYILSAFLGASVPTGTYSNGTLSAIIAPTIAAGKGFGSFDFQTTFGVSIPTAYLAKQGTPIAHNVAFQYRALKRFWPELEVNSTFWANGTQSGKKQVYLSPGLVVGKLPLWRRLGLTVGGGVQLPITSFHTQDRNWLVSVRLPF